MRVLQRTVQGPPPPYEGVPGENGGGQREGGGGAGDRVGVRVRAYAIAWSLIKSRHVSVKETKVRLNFIFLNMGQAWYVGGRRRECSDTINRSTIENQNTSR